MNQKFLKSPFSRGLATVAAGLCIGYAGFAAGQMKIMLSGDQEVPPVATSAKGSGTITVGADKSVSGGITTTGLAGTMAHIHEAPAGKNGPVIVPMEKDGDNGWKFPAGAKLTDAQYEAYKAGNLYVNVHSAANKGGEIRVQLKP
jgi:CHRD domain